MKEYRSKLLSNPHPALLKKLEEVIIPSDGVKYKLKKVVDGTPPVEGLEIIGEELTDGEWDDIDNENNPDENRSGNMNVVDDVEEHENVDEAEAAGDQADAAASSSVQKSETASLDPKIKADLECLSSVGCVVDTVKKLR